MRKLCRSLRLLAALCALTAGGACAHPTQMSRITLTEAPTASGVRVHGRLEVSPYDLGEATARTAIADADGRPVPAAIAEAREALEGYLAAHTRILTADGAACVRRRMSLRPAGNLIAADFDWQCPPGTTRIYRTGLFHDIDTGARQIVVIQAGETHRQTLLDVLAPRVTVAAPPTVAAVFGRYLRAGIAHIFIGFDHLAFLLAVVLWARRILPLVFAVTAFTLAHSVTLALAVWEVVRLPASLVEAVIAATIIYVAAENFFVRDLARRWRTTGLLGLVHGFGFASVLRDYGLPQQDMALALAAFNLGVEAGQIAFVTVAVTVLCALDRVSAPAAAPARSPRLVHGVSLALGLCGIYWLMQRTGGALRFA